MTRGERGKGAWGWSEISDKIRGSNGGEKTRKVMRQEWAPST